MIDIIKAVYTVYTVNIQVQFMTYMFANLR